MIDIKRYNGPVLVSLKDYPEGALVHYELMSEHYVKLSFTLSEPIYLKVGDYIECEFGKFSLLQPYRPTYNVETDAFDYNVQLDAYYMQFSNKLCKYLPYTTSSEASFKLTANLETHLSVVLSNINALCDRDDFYLYNGKKYTFMLFGIDSEKAGLYKYIEYNDVDIITALNKIAEAFGCEWWIDGNVIFFGKCQIGEEVNFELGTNVESMSSSESSNEYATRLIAFGSEKNLPADYRSSESADITKDGVVQRRLMLPISLCPKGYVEEEGISEQEAVEAIFVNEDIYPRTKCEVSEVIEYTSSVENEDGTISEWTFYRLKDGSGFSFSSDMILENQNLHIQFASGKLNGMDFVCQYNDTEKYYEVVVNEDYGRKLPDSILKPEAGDQFVLYNWDATKIAETGIIEAAEKELYDSAIAKLEEMKKDPNTYDCTMYSDWYSEYIDTSSSLAYSIGQRVKLVNLGYFQNGRSSRIIGYEIKLDIPYDSPKYIVGESAAYSKTREMQSKLESLTYNGISYSSKGTGTGGSSVYVIGSSDSTIPSDYNVYSAKRSDSQFLRKDKEDIAKRIITFLLGTYWGNFTSNTGAAMTVDPTTGQTYMEVDRLKVRLKAFFERLEVQKVGFVGGKLIVTKGQGVDILDVENIYDTEGNVSAYRCYFLGEQEGRKIDNLLRVKDQMICKDFNVSEGSTDWATNKYYWRLATAVSSDVVKRGNNVCHWVDLSATDCDTNSDIPEIGDTICHLGNREDTDRQGAEILSVVDANSPSFTIYSGINSYSLVNKEYIDMGVVNGKAYCNIYGSTYIGDRDRKSGYLRWNDDKKTFEIKGTIDITSPLSSGGTIGGAIDDAANAYKGEFDAFTSNVNEVIGGFQAQIDGVIETWFYDPEPTLGNPPASEWTDNTTKDKHLGDLYYSGEGLAYRFQKEGDNYVWKKIDDTAITKALAEAKAANDAANAAQGTADSKMRVFVAQPTADDEYSVGDMWVNATYPADGTTYKDDILKCKTPKSKGTAFSIDHWEKASKYTDDTAAKAAQKAADDANASITELGGTVSGIYNLTDDIFRDRVIDKTERDSLQKVLADLEQDWADVASSYSKLTGNSLYDSIAADVRTAFKSAYDKLKATYDSFVAAVNNVISATQVTDSLINGLYNNYENFKTDYAAYVSKMTVVTKQIDAILNKSVSDLVTELGGYKYLKKATAENNTLIEGGLILSTLIGLGYTDTNKLFHVMSGMSGIYDTQKAGNGIAFWAGGSMVDKQYDASDNPAQFLVRHDGTGYAAGGNLWWEKDGRVHADPMSFIINEDNLGNLLGLFKPIYSGGSEYKNITGIEPLFQFTKLRVEGGNIVNGELIGGLQIGDTAKFYIKDGVLFLEGDLAVTGGITMYASNGVTSGMIDQVYAVLDPTIFSKQGDYITIKGDIGGGTVKAVKVGSTQYDPDSNGIISLPEFSSVATIEWDDILNKPSSFPPSAHTHAISDITNLQATLDGKAAASHTHAIADITNISSASVSYATSAGNADTVDGYHALSGSNTPFGTIPVITSSGWMDVGRQFEFHYDNTTGSDYSTALICKGNYKNIVYLPSGNGTLALLTDNVASASKWQTARTLTLTGSVTGSVSIDGSGNVSLVTTTNHTHSYITIPVCSSLDGNFNDFRVEYAGGGNSVVTKPSGVDAFGVMRLRTAEGWCGQIMMSANTAPGMYYRNANGLTSSVGWKKLLDSGNFGDYAAAKSHSHSYLPLSGGTLTGNLTLSNSACIYGAGGFIDMQYNDEINRYGGTLFLQHRGGSVTGSGTGSSSTTGDVWICCNGGNIQMGNGGGTLTMRGSISVTSNVNFSGLPEGKSTVTDNTEILTSWASNNGFEDSNAVGTVYRRDAVYLYNYIKGKTDSVYLPLSGGTMASGARISHGNGNLYLGNADNNGWLMCQDMCSQSGYTYWSLMTNGSFTATSILSKGGITMYSDLRKKNVLSNEVLSVKEIAAAPLFRHTYKSDNNQYIHVGTSAQYWSGIHEDWFTRKDGEGYYQMELQNLGVAMGISLAREIVKYESKTDKKIRLMRKRINELEARVKELEERRIA